FKMKDTDLNSPGFSRNSKVVQFFDLSRGLGIRVVNGIDLTKSTVWLVSAIFPGSDAADNGQLCCGDRITSLNGNTVVGFTADQLHSLLLREKLRREPWLKTIFDSSSVNIGYVPSNIPLSDLFPRRYVNGTTTSRLSISRYLYPGTSPRNSNNDVSCRVNQSAQTTETSDLKFEASSGSSSSSSNIQRSSPQRRMSFSENEKIEVYKLCEALNYLGTVSSEEQITQLKRALKKSDNDLVQYGDFVKAMLKVFHEQLHTLYVDNSLLKNHTSDESNPYLNGGPSSVRKTSSNTETESKLTEELKELKEKMQLIESENTLLKEQLAAMKDFHRRNASEVDNARMASQRELENIKLDYEEVIRSLEAELTNLQSSENCLAKLDPNNEMEKQVAVAECEWRKLDIVRKSNEETVECLLAFVNKVVQSDAKTYVKYNKSHEAIETLEQLATEAEHLYLTVSNTIQIKFHSLIIRSESRKKELPFGWEQASLGDGRIYFIDHVNHITSWSDPRIKVTFIQRNNPKPHSCRRRTNIQRA
uniref:Syntaxin-binding protein 4 n=1 Tax=Ciona intestinalis TaxID=7719 RepID=F6PZ91_CIOIN